MGSPTITAAPKEFKGALVRNSTGITLPNATYTTMTFDTEIYDTHGFHDSVTNPERLTIPVGVKKVRLYMFGNFSGSSNAQINLFSNNAIPLNGDLYSSADENNDNDIMHTTPVFEVSEGDYFYFQLRQSTGGSSSTSANQTCFGIEVVE